MDIKFKTLTGLALDELARKLDEELPKEAYSAVPGAADLTDIDPNWMRKIFNEVFGMCGVGWGYKYDPADLHIYAETRNRSSGGTRNVHIAALKRMTFWYKVIDEQGVVVTCEINASGGSENDVEAYAMKGAITNAIGNAASNIGFQESVYLGHRSHKTVGKSASTSKRAAVAKPNANTSAPSTNASASTLRTSSKNEGLSASASDDPAQFVVKIGKRAGKTLAAIYTEDNGAAAIQFYTTMATSNNADKEALKNAAIAFLAKHNGHIPQSVAA